LAEDREGVVLADSVLTDLYHTPLLPPAPYLRRLKVVQLEELLAIRHCVFIMGPPGAGKTQCWKTLAQARKLRNNPTKVRTKKRLISVGKSRSVDW
jgi:SpoVK/Ycf46/Vps4 family AAA+-type ATPase